MSNPLPKFREIAERYILWYHSLVSQVFHTVFLSSYRKRMDDFNTNFHLDQPGGPPPPLVAPHGGPGGGMDDGSSQMPSQRQVQVIHCQINTIFWHLTQNMTTDCSLNYIFSTRYFTYNCPNRTQKFKTILCRVWGIINVNLLNNDMLYFGWIEE